jgi:Domain of unknown function (DUF4157)
MHVRIKQSTPPSPARLASRGAGEATARAAASGSTPLGSAAQRMNAGPHAASLAGLQAVVAQRACAGCEHVRRAMGGADPAQRAAKHRGGLPDGLRAGLESLSGRDLSGVSVHYDSPKPAQLNAHAYAQGSEIHLAPGQERHLPHEGWHAVQQMQSRVRPTTSVGGTPVNDSARLEREADVMGARAMSAGGAAQRASRAGTSGAGTAQRRSVSSGAPVQRKLRVDGTDYDGDNAQSAYDEALAAGASETEAETILGMALDDNEPVFASWEAVLANLRGEEVPDDDSDDDLGDVEDEEALGDQNPARLPRLDRVIRVWAKRAGGHDSSGHGKGKKISSGHSRDRHNHGQKRKVQHKQAKVGSLDSALAEFVSAGGTVGDLDARTVQWLNKSGLSWRPYFQG